MFCRNCGNQVPDQAKFCSHCGAALGNASSQSGTSQQPSQRQAASQQPVDEKAFRKYITPYLARNIFLVICGLTAICLLVSPQVAFIFAITAACFGIPWALSSTRVSRQIAGLKSGGTYEEVLREYASSRPMLDGKVRYADHYIFAKGSGRFFRYSDIAWLYRHSLSYLFFPVLSEAIVGDTKGTTHSFCKLKLSSKSGGDEIKRLASLIHSKNPNVLLGYDDKRAKEYRSRTR